MYPTKSPNVILDMGRLCLRNERIRELSDSGEDVQEFKIDDTLLLESTVFHEYCFKSLFLTFSGQPSVISNYFWVCKKSQGRHIPGFDDIPNFLSNITQNKKNGTSNGGLFNQQWTVCPELSTLTRYD
jgi:hypothetical protein